MSEGQGSENNEISTNTADSSENHVEPHVAAFSQKVTAELRTPDGRLLRERATDADIIEVKDFFGRMIGPGGPYHEEHPYLSTVIDFKTGKPITTPSQPDATWKPTHWDTLKRQLPPYNDEVWETYIRQERRIQRDLAGQLKEDGDFREKIFPIVFKSIEDKMELDRLRKAAYNDPLTETLNQNYARTELPIRVAQRLAASERTAILMVDVDRFKEINDSQGHAAGDDALREIAQILKSNVRGSDSVIRNGGDEFIVILEDLDLHTAQEVAERIRAAGQRTGANRYGYTFSIGVAYNSNEWPIPSSSEEFIKQADNAMYYSKQTRDAVTIFDPNVMHRLPKPNPTRKDA